MGKGKKEGEITHSAGEIGREGKSVKGMMMMVLGKKENGREIPLLRIRDKKKSPHGRGKKDFSTASTVKSIFVCTLFPVAAKKDTFFFPGYNGIESIDDMVLQRKP